MPTISTSFTGTVQDLDDFCDQMGFTLNALPGETKANFFKRMLRTFAVAKVRARRQQLAIDATVQGLPSVDTFT